MFYEFRRTRLILKIIKAIRDQILISGGYSSYKHKNILSDIAGKLAVWKYKLKMLKRY